MKISTPFFSLKFCIKKCDMKSSKVLNISLILLFCLNIFQLRAENEIDFANFSYQDLQEELDKKKNENKNLLIVVGTSVAALLVGGSLGVYCIRKSLDGKIKDLREECDALKNSDETLKKDYKSFLDELKKYKDEIEELKAKAALEGVVVEQKIKEVNLSGSDEEREGVAEKIVDPAGDSNDGSKGEGNGSGDGGQEPGKQQLKENSGWGEKVWGFLGY